MKFNDTYLNRTPNKTARNTKNFKPEFVVMHETAGYGSLDWNLRPDVRSSYNYLISRSGVVYHYIDEKAYIAWHAGVNSAARGYTGGQLNVYALGVELEGPNDGTPITTAQTKAMVELLRFFNTTYAIPLTREYFVGHKDVAPGYKSDPKGYSVEYTLKIITEAAPAPDVRPDTLYAALLNAAYKLAGGEYRPDWTFHQYAATHDLGMPIKVGMDFTTKGIRYTGEVYGRNIIISPYNQWNIVLRANELTDNAVYDDLMRFAYGVLGVAYRPEQAFAHFVRRNNIGVPLTESQRFQVASGASVAAQLYTLDTLYTPIAGSGVTDWSIVRQMSALVAQNNINQADAALRDVLYRTMYGRVAFSYDPNAAFVIRAIKDQLGAPLSGQRTLTHKNTSYSYVVYAGDLVFAPVNQPSAVKRLRDIR